MSYIFCIFVRNTINIMQREIKVGSNIGTWEVLKSPYLEDGKYHTNLKCQKCGYITSFKVKYINRSYFLERSWTR